MVANAGIARLGSVLTSECHSHALRSPAHRCPAGVEEYQRVMDTNAKGVFLCYKHAGLKMVQQKRGGRIVGEGCYDERCNTY